MERKQRKTKKWEEERLVRVSSKVVLALYQYYFNILTLNHFQKKKKKKKKLTAFSYTVVPTWRLME